ncbi:MAG: lytic transglycosylase [Flavobacteriales bacterium]|nr:lytic transglycosylase [Flavobacteriales bacterium]|tara:strand:+ start:15955 stop:17445 length:1491 start_codon:yes stop_codon:yes gene_type:complete
MKNWIKILFIVIAKFVAAQSDAVNSPSDSLFKDSTTISHILDDDPFLEMLDSLHEARIFNKNPISYDISILNIHNFPLDSIPEYPDSILQLRMQDMNAFSPIEFTFNGKVKRCINVYGKNRRHMLSKVMGMAELYFPLFEEELEKNDLPLELKYLPIVESALNNTVRSRAGAVGMWQFMYRTGKYLGLEINSYIDERRDPIKSTQAAVKYLSYLYEIYDDWLLALAAYNAGPGNVNKAIRRSGGKKNFWEIQYGLPLETRNYIPSFMAVAYLLNHAADHNLYPVKPKFEIRNIDTVVIKQPLHFNQIAEVLCISNKDLAFLNPQYKRAYIPIRENDSCKYFITLPVSLIGDFLTNEETIYNYKSKDLKTTPVDIYANRREVVHRVRNGESVGLIAQRYNVRISEIREWNNLSNKKYIYPGQKLVIFAKKNSSTHGYTIKEEQTYNGYLYYTIRSGDTLWDIAKKYEGVSANDIMKLNRMSARKILKPGMKIKIKST